MNVLHVVTDTDRRGAQVFATDLRNAMVRDGRDARVVALAEGSVGGLDVPALGPSRRSLGALAALRREMAAADVTVAHGSTTVLACSMAGLGRGRPFVVRQISETTFWVDRLSRRLRVAWYLRRADAVVALAHPAALTLQDYLRVDPQKVHVIPNGVPADGFEPDRDRSGPRGTFGLDLEGPVVGYVGALVPEKGADRAIEAVGLLPEVSLLVVGDGPERQHLEDLAQRRAPGRVFFTGSISTLADAYAAIDLLVLPSRGGDSMPAVLIEAGFCGVPSLATDVGAISDVVVDGVTGCVVARNDDAGFTAALADLLRDPVRLAAFGEAARAHCLGRFEIGVVARQWIEVLESVS